MTWVVNNLGWIGELTLRHLVLASVAIVVALLVSVPVGWLANRWRLGREALIALVGAIYAIPSLPMFIVIPIITGAPIRSMATVVIVLSLYGVALLVRTVADAFAALPRDVIRASESLGYSGWWRFWGVELPLTGPVILAGLRVVIVNTVSLVTVGAVVGIQSVGTLFTDGFQRGIIAEVVAGLIVTIALALALDAVAVFGGRLIFPWTRGQKIRPQPLLERAAADSSDADHGPARGDGVTGGNGVVTGAETKAGRG
ncbi:ABC transporter permease subunit [Trueperella pecoris]|uniref:ABC transporter permease subunit n=1 Tax=Trueperella pecoris TaxID=2733571 RepID=A0A7M1QZI5_9ACTO|nr:ABC transporter permease subunit [Trueperella pecoris]QOR47303.1 ABC transporter permease subunit [Trueperella pecoris]